MLIFYWVGVLTIHILLFAPISVDAEEVYGPQNAPQSIPSTQDKEGGGKVPTTELIDDPAHPAEHALKSLPTKSDYTIIPLPAFASNHNEGYWVGMNPPILKADSKGEVKEVLMPQYLYNRLIGHYGSLNYFAYPSDTEQYHALAWFGQKLDQGIDWDIRILTRVDTFSLPISLHLKTLSRDFSASGVERPRHRKQIIPHENYSSN